MSYILPVIDFVNSGHQTWWINCVNIYWDTVYNECAGPVSSIQFRDFLALHGARYTDVCPGPVLKFDVEEDAVIFILRFSP